MLAERVTQWTEKWMMAGEEKGIEKGKIENAQQMLLKTLMMKFGTVNPLMANRITSIHSQASLDKLFERAFNCASMEEFEGYLISATDN